MDWIAMHVFPHFFTVYEAMSAGGQIITALVIWLLPLAIYSAVETTISGSPRTARGWREKETYDATWMDHKKWIKNR